MEMKTTTQSDNISYSTSNDEGQLQIAIITMRSLSIDDVTIVLHSAAAHLNSLLVTGVHVSPWCATVCNRVYEK